MLMLLSGKKGRYDLYFTVILIILIYDDAKNLAATKWSFCCTEHEIALSFVSGHSKYIDLINVLIWYAVFIFVVYVWIAQTFNSTWWLSVFHLWHHWTWVLLTLCLHYPNIGSIIDLEHSLFIDQTNCVFVYTSRKKLRWK